MRSGWLGSVAHGEPIVFCGDFNSVPGLPVYRLMATLLRDVQTARRNRLDRAHPTFSSRWPRLRLDHMFVSPAFEVLAAQVPAHEPYRTVSDHLPLWADLRLDPNKGGGTGK